MTAKLTLSVEKRVIKKAKQYAQKHNKSLSEIVTSYLDFLSREKGTTEEIDPDVLEVADEISIEKLPQLKDPRYQHLKDKYLHE